MIQRNIDNKTTCFIDTDINDFREDVIVLEKESIFPPITVEVNTKSKKGDLWVMYFDGANYKDGSGAGILLISPKGNTYKFSFTLSFSCTNNIVEYEALLMGLRLACKHGIKCVHLVGDSELVVSQVILVYASKNKRLK